MSQSAAAPQNEKPSMLLFWGCFIALITTSYAFFSRMYLADVRFATEFGVDKVMIGALKGAGVWPFAISIILFSLIIDRIGYKVAMLFSFVCYIVYTVLGMAAYATVHGATPENLPEAQKLGYSLLYWGSVILGLGNGTVEAFINPVVATMFNREKTKWLNILHAGWPGGLVIGGLCSIALAEQAKTGDWRVVLGLILVPAILYLVMLIGMTFPKNEREAAGVGYGDMLKEFGLLGALIAFGLIFLELGNVFGFAGVPVYILTGTVTLLFAVVTKSIGRPILVFLIIIMCPLAVTEIGTDGWITGLMEEPMKAAGFDPGWVLIYTSAIMMVLRFFAGPIVHSLSPIGLLITSCVLAIAGLTALSTTVSSGLAVIFGAATLYGFGKTFFWPTMLGITAEQCPKGGALTLNAISGIGMLAVGVLGFPFIGSLQEQTASSIVAKAKPDLLEKVSVDKSYVLGGYKAIDVKKKEELADEADKQIVKDAEKQSQFSALASMAMFPTFMLVCYLGLWAYFTSRGGYKAEVLVGHGAEDAKFTGGVEGAVEG